MLLHNIDGGSILRKLWHLSPTLDVVDPKFHIPFDKALQGEHLCTQLNLPQLDPLIQLKVTALVKKYWSVFNEHEVWVPVWNYKYVIETCDAHTIAVKKIQY
jgi:hypothetical protein